MQFRVIGKGNVEIVDVLNHFYVEGMQIERAQNPCLSEYSLVEQSGYGKNVLKYILKSELAAGMENDDGPRFYQTEKHLENFFALKRSYQEGGVQEEVTEESGEQRAQFDTLRIVQSETNKAFREVMTQEYQMLKVYKPQLLVDVQERTQLAEDIMSYSQRKVTVDASRLNDTEYLKSVKGMQESSLSEK